MNAVETKIEAANQLQTLRDVISEGDTIYTVFIGMVGNVRRLKVMRAGIDESKGQPFTADITYGVAAALGYTYKTGYMKSYVNYLITTQYGQDIVDSLSRALFTDYTKLRHQSL